MVVDASQGVQAQTISNLYMALEEYYLEIIPVMNKCDMASAMPEEVEDEIIDLLGCKREDIIREVLAYLGCWVWLTLAIRN